MIKSLGVGAARDFFLPYVLLHLVFSHGRPVLLNAAPEHLGFL